MAAELHLAKETFALHLLLQRLEGLVDIVVANENLHDGFLLDSTDPDMDMDSSGADGNCGTNTARGDPFQRHNGVGRSNHQINNAKAKADIGAALARISEMLPNPPITRNQVELMLVDNTSMPEMPGLGALGISPHSGQERTS